MLHEGIILSDYATLMVEILRDLGGHLKTGHTWTLQNRPTERNQNKSIYTLRGAFGQTFFADWLSELILALPGRRIRQRRDATGAPTQRPEWRGGVSRPFGDILAQKR